MGIHTGGNLVVPLVLWGHKHPSHNITALSLSFDLRTVITGSSEGQLCLWNISEDKTPLPRCMLFGHTGSITCISPASKQKQLVVSASDTGEMCLWDLEDGRCMENKKSSPIHTCIQVYKFSANDSMSLICNGNYPEIHIIDPISLELMYALVARVHPDWINALCVLKPVKREDDVIIAMTSSGTIKMWSIATNSVRSTHVYEDESKQIRCVDAQTLRCCPYNQRTVLIVCSKYWQAHNIIPACDAQVCLKSMRTEFTLMAYNKSFKPQKLWFSLQPNNFSDIVYDAGEFSLLCYEPCSSGNRWTGGEFIAIDKVLVWNSIGQAFLYKLPTNTNPEHMDYHHLVGQQAVVNASPSLYCILDTENSKMFPTASLFVCRQDYDGHHVVLRADADGSVNYWSLSRHPPQRVDEHLPTLHAKTNMSLSKLWELSNPVGLLDHVESYTGEMITLTCSLYVEQSARLLCGRSDGSIVIIPIINTIKTLLLTNNQEGKFPLHRVLTGHTARVNCLLYPHAVEARYNPNYLVSGSSDFTVNLWDLSLGQLVHTFSLHAGEITNFYIPPPTCKPRVLSCICSVANDHSVALLSLKDRRCLLFASRHMFPVQCIKWRPLEDFMIVSCTDSTVYVWEIETGLLDRVVHGVTADEMLRACEEVAQKVNLADNPTNPQISISQAFKRRNMATFRNLAQQTIQQLENMVDEDDMTGDFQGQTVSINTQPLLVHGLQTRVEDPEAHLLLFNTEALIVQLLCDEFGVYSMEDLGLSQSAYPQSVEQKITGFINMVKEKAEGSQIYSAIQNKAENLGISIDMKPAGSTTPNSQRRRRSSGGSSGASSGKDSGGRLDNVSMEIVQVFMSILHAWGLDEDLDRLCLRKLGIDRLCRAVCYGLISQNGHMVLMLPNLNQTEEYEGSTREYWEISQALTTQHLLSVISLTNTLMSMTDATFIKQSSHKKLPSTITNGDSEGGEQTRQSQIKQGWSLLAALHCVLLPDKVKSSEYRSPQLHLLANRWQDRCLEVREASQALLLAELRRIGVDGRREVIAEWSPHMPDLVDASNGSITMAEPEELILNVDDEEYQVRKVNNEKRRLEATAIVMLGVIGAEFGSEIQPNRRDRAISESRGSAEGFGLSNNSLAWHTSKALAYLLLNPQDCKLPPHAPVRRAAIDLLGRGFTVWQPYIDVSAVLLGLLEICYDADRILPSVQSGLPLTPAADACRTARHALSLIATAQPATFLTCMAREVARYNAAAQNAQSGSSQLNSSVLVKAKSEILRVIELLIDKLPNDVVDLLLEAVDIAVHCLDPNSIKMKGLQETFPALCKFPMVSYCMASRRICVGSKHGSLAFHEIKQAKAQTPFQASPAQAMIFFLRTSSKETLSAHKGAVAAVSFSDDGKYLASYSPGDAKVHFWQTASSSLFGIGSQHTKCVKSYNVPFKAPGPSAPNMTKGGRLHWSDSRTVSLLLPNGAESKYRV